MKKQHQMLSIILILFFLDGKLLAIETPNKQSNITDNVRFFQGSNSKNQLGGRNATTITYKNIDGLNDYTIYDNGTFTYNISGVYFGIFAAQIGSPRRNGVGEVHIWIRRGTVDKPNANSIQSVPHGTTSVLIYQTVFLAPVGRGSSLVFSTYQDNKCTSLGLIAAAPENEPVVPSIISSTIQLSDAINIIPYALLSSSETQLGKSSSAAIRIDTVSGNTAVDTTTSANNGAIKYNISGIYFIIACAQVGSNLTTDASGQVHMWIRLNGVDVPDSNTIQTIDNGTTEILVDHIIVKLKANDELRIMFSTTHPRLGVIASTPINEPAAPSIVISTFQLRNEGDTIPYIQLSNSNSQWGCFTPQIVNLDDYDGAQDITSTNNTIHFSKSGTYFFIAAAQVGSDGNRGIGDVHVWMRLNGQDMKNSNTIQSVNDDISVLVCQSIVVIQAGDELQLMFSTDVTRGTLGLVANQPANEPLAPSMILSVFRSSYSNGVLINHNLMNTGGD